MPLLSGINAVREALLAPHCGLASIALSQKSHNPRLQELRRLAHEKGIPIQEVSDEALRRMAGRDTHQGVVARLAEFQYSSYEEVLSHASSPGLVVVLDGVEDPQNLGAVLRTAEGAGVSGVFIPERRAASMTAAAVKASAGAAAHVRVSRQTNLSRLLERLQKDGYWVVGLDASARDLWTQPDYTVPTALVLGSEGHGIRPLVRSHCDFLVRLPMFGQVGSLNVSVAAGIVLYEILRQRLPGAR